ncbi:MAG: CvpA family protein [Amoebophilaceae bacterium TMED152]|nr:MAG: CvpA family protein [Amoebophilaceae bacterium TMED152]
MNLIDLIFSFFLIFYTYRGYKKGFIVSFISLFSFFVSIIISLNFSNFFSNILMHFFPESNNLIIGFLSIFFTFMLSFLIISWLTKSIKHIIDLTFIGLFDDVFGALFGFIKTALIISFVINIFQYFDVTVMEEEIRSSVISYFLMDFAPKTLSIFVDFFPSLEVIVESNDELKKIDV